MERLGWVIFRIGIASIFLYFGILALLNPQIQAQTWMAPKMAQIISPVLPVETFMIFFGVFEILVGLSIFLGYALRVGLTMGAFMLIGIIFNLAMVSGFNDVILRDIVILTGIFYLLVI
jgi:uncharacterized membrane protein YphA (DoxX/SURF4 family)